MMYMLAVKRWPHIQLSGHLIGDREVFYHQPSRMAIWRVCAERRRFGSGAVDGCYEEPFKDLVSILDSVTASIIWMVSSSRFSPNDRPSRLKSLECRPWKSP